MAVYTNWQQNQPGYPNIFDAANCSLISQLLPAGPKKFLADFMDGNAFRNPIGQVAGILKDKLGDNIGKIGGLGGVDGLNGDLAKLNGAMSGANTELSAFLAHTNRLSGVSVDGDNGILPRLDEIIGTVSAYNSIKDLLKNPGDLLEDNFSNAFSSLNPQIVGPFFENFGSNMNSISTVLGNIQNQLDQGGLTDLAEMVGQLQQLTDNITSITANIQTLINNDNNYFALALAFVERYVLGNTILSTALTDPCFGAQLVKNLITNPESSKSIDDIAAENGVKIEGAPVNLLDNVPSLQPVGYISPTTTPAPTSTPKTTKQTASSAVPPATIGGRPDTPRQRELIERIKNRPRLAF